MRGTRELRREGGKIITGIIPAYAGNTGGEGAGHGHASGSSPRMRGTHLVVREVVLMAGIIPAYAGNTWSWWCSASIPWDHPRVCGEHKWNETGTFALEGSSPRMRGTQDQERYGFG